MRVSSSASYIIARTLPWGKMHPKGSKIAPDGPSIHPSSKKSHKGGFAYTIIYNLLYPIYTRARADYQNVVSLVCLWGYFCLRIHKEYY